MKKTIAVSALTLVLSILGNATAGAQNREHQQMTAELRMLQEQTQQLALSLAQIGEAIKALNARLDSSDQSAQKRFADQELLLKGLSTELSAVRDLLSHVVPSGKKEEVLLHVLRAQRKILERKRFGSAKTTKPEEAPASRVDRSLAQAPSM